MSAATRLADLTTLRVGGPARRYVAATSEAEITAAVARADAAGEAVLMLGAGSNMVVGDAGFAGLVVHDARDSIPPVVEMVGGTALVTAVAGRVWDDLVADAVAAGLAGIEAMSGIPGTVGAAPVQNVGAYGQDISQTLRGVRAWDRELGETVTLSAADLEFSYRDSLLKRSMHQPQAQGPGRGASDAPSADSLSSSNGESASSSGSGLAPASAAGGHSRWWPSPRYIVLEVTLALVPSAESMPLQWEELARNLGVPLGGRAPLAQVRAEVLRLRAARGTLLDGYGGRPPGDHDRWSVGSFFTNPIISVEQAAHLPAEVPRFPLGEHEVGDESATRVQVPAAWLIENSGFGKGFGLHGLASRATVSGLHCLALTNRGGATAADVVELARAVRAGVRARFGLTLVPEPNLIGVEI